LLAAGAPQLIEDPDGLLNLVLAKQNAIPRDDDNVEVAAHQQHVAGLEPVASTVAEDQPEDGAIADWAV
jgi:hypothetical protein